jgi:hypothetical protein
LGSAAAMAAPSAARLEPKPSTCPRFGSSADILNQMPVQ